MEAIAAFSLACNVIQVVEFGLKTINTCREIYDHGSTSQQKELELMTRHLAAISKDLDGSVRSAQTAKRLSRDEQELQNLAVRCTEAAKKLQAELDGLNSIGTGRRAALYKTIKFLRRKSVINDLSEKLKDYESFLNTKLLTRLSYRLDAQALQQETSFKQLEDILQLFIVNLGNGLVSIHDVVKDEGVKTRGVVIAGNTDTKQHITKSFELLRLTVADEEACAKFLRSLHFPNIDTRQEEISDAHRKTFEWIFKPSDNAGHRWDSFEKWLESGDGIFWINGKVGSGKSTLVNYICTNDRTVTALRKWNHEPFMAIFFFWNAGTEMQKSIQGLVRSLLYQLLDGEQRIIPKLIQSLGTSVYSDTAWSIKKLKSVLAYAITAISRPLCFFLDGLDEFEEDENELIDFIRDLYVNNANLKICLSSRPLLCFERAFGKSPQLRLQDLTQEDIKKFVNDRLGDSPRMQELIRKESKDSEQAASLTNAVVEKAEGIFLWVELAVKILLRGLANEDDWSTLERRLDLLPKGIENLYSHMWARLREDKTIYVRDAALYFQMMMVEIPMKVSLLEFVIAIDDNLQSKIMDALEPVTEEYMVSQSEIVRTHILTRCAGLLEVEIPVQEKTFELVESQTPRLQSLYDATHVRFIHRTARDFLKDTQDGKAIMHSCPISLASAVSCVIKGILGSLLMDIKFKEDLEIASRLLGILTFSSRAGYEIEEDLLIDIERVFKKVVLHRSGRSTSNWFLDMVSPYGGKEKWSWTPAVDFLGLASVFDVHPAVSQRISREERHHDDVYRGYLLSCAVWLPHRTEPILTLLRQGANPRFSMPKLDGPSLARQVSCWRRFLTIRWIWHLNHARNKTPLASPSALAEVSEAFIINGADPLEFIRVIYAGGGWWTMGRDGSQDFEGSQNFLIVEFSPAYVLASYMRCTPAFSRIEARFTSNEAQEIRRVAVIFAGNEPEVWSRLTTEKDSTYLLEAIDKCEKEQLKSAQQPSHPAVEDLQQKILEVHHRNERSNTTAVASSWLGGDVEHISEITWTQIAGYTADTAGEQSELTIDAGSPMTSDHG